MSAYESGTVAMVTALNRSTPWRAFFDGKTWRECGADAFCVDTPTSVHPLVVLDPDDLAQAESLAKALVEAMYAAGDRYSAANGVHAGTVSTALRALVKPRIPEPGLWAVVEASTCDDPDRRKFGRVPSDGDDADQWTESYDEVWRAWSDLVDPTLVRPGIEDAS